MFVNKASEPLAQSASLIRNFVQLTGHRSRFQGVQYIRWNKLGLRQPTQQAIAAVEPVNGFIGRRRDGVQEIAIFIFFQARDVLPGASNSHREAIARRSLITPRRDTQVTWLCLICLNKFD